MSAEVIPLRPRADAPVQRFPQADRAGEIVDQFARDEDAPSRPHFGLRPPSGLFYLNGGIDAAMDLARREDRRSDYIRRAAKAAADAMQDRAPDPKAVCASLLYEAAGRANAL